MDDDTLSRRYRTAEGKFNRLVDEIRLPFLEVMLYRKYYLDIQTENRLQCLEEIISTMNEHRIQTLRMLKLVDQRESVVSQIIKCSEDYEQKKRDNLEIQATVLRLLHEHQTFTMQIVEGIVTWRDLLTRPYPFQWKGHNYVYKITADCAYLDGCSVRAILPLKLAQFPLCSNLSSLALFGEKKDRRHKLSPSHPRPNSQQVAAQQAARIRAAETFIHEERALQRRLMRELESIAATGSFVPLLNVSHIVPDAVSGIRITRKDWDDQHREAVHQAVLLDEEGAKQQFEVVPAKGDETDSKPHSDSITSPSDSGGNSPMSALPPAPATTPVIANLNVSEVERDGNSP